jgi:hypothetical protein
MSRSEDFSVSDIVVGEVTGVAPWGFCIRITDDVEGLLGPTPRPRGALRMEDEVPSQVRNAGQACRSWSRADPVELGNAPARARTARSYG